MGIIKGLNRKVTQKNPELTRYLNVRSGGRRSVAGPADLAAPPEDAKAVGMIMMFLAFVFSVSFFCCNFLPEIPRWLAYVPFPAFLFAHVILIFGEGVLIREIWRSGTSMLIIWGSLLAYVLIEAFT